MLPVNIRDGGGSERGAEVDDKNRLVSINPGIPPFGSDLETRIFRDYFRNSAGSENMAVNGSTDSVDFLISSSQIADRYISSISFVISDANSELNKFGGLTALTNGVQIFYEDDAGLVIIDDALQTNFDIIRLCQGNPAFGNSTTSFLAPKVSPPPGDDAYIPILDFKSVFGIPYGVRLESQSFQRLFIRIKDDLTALSQFDVVAYGFDRLGE